jgi:hypothetical protein
MARNTVKDVDDDPAYTCCRCFIGTIIYCLCLIPELLDYMFVWLSSL